LDQLKFFGFCQLILKMEGQMTSSNKYGFCHDPKVRKDIFLNFIRPKSYEHEYYQHPETTILFKVLFDDSYVHYSIGMSRVCLVILYFH